MENKITNKAYFWIAIVIPLLLAFFSALIVFFDQKPSFCLSKICIDYFLDLYSVTIQLIGLTLILVGAAFTYYRIDLSFKQNERQIYKSFRDEFLEILRAKPYEYEILDIPDIWLFNNLYPDAKNGDQHLHPEFEEFITKKDERTHLGFTESMNNLSKVIGTKDQYHAGSHFPLGNMFMWLKDFLPIDTDLNIGFKSGEIFEGDYSKHIINLSKDIFFIVSSVNAFEGWRFFDNKTKRIWRKKIDKLLDIPTECNFLHQFFKNANKAQWISTLSKRDFDKFRTYSLSDVLPTEINHKNAKEFIFEHYTTVTKSITEEKAIQCLKEKLQL